MDVDVQHHARTRALRSDHHVRSGPFVVRYAPDWSSPAANYAIPDDGATPTASEIAALVDTFRTRDRLPRLEYLPGCAPEVEQALRTAGFTVESRAAIMSCTAETLVQPPAVDGVFVTEPTDDAGFLAAAGVQHTAYGESGPPDSGVVTWLRTAGKEGGVVALVTDGGGTAVGAGVCSVPIDGLSELTGVAVAADHRRRGIGGMVSAYLTAAIMDRGCREVWLEPDSPDIAGIYARIGYRTIGEKLNISLR